MKTLSPRELLARLVSFDSVSDKSNEPIAEFIHSYAMSAGCGLVRHRYDEDQPEEKFNLLLYRGDPRAGGGLMLSGHMDVVPAVEPDWVGGPFEMAERDGRFFGRGTADMKGFVALALDLMIRSRDADLKHPLMLLLTADEEIGTVGAQRFAASWPGDFPLPKECLIGEPTGMRVVRMHKGHLRATVRVRGKPAHGAYPHLGVNAIELAGQVVGALADLRAEMSGMRTATSEFIADAPSPVLNVGMIRGGSAINIVAETCEMDFGLRMMPGQTSMGGVELVRRAIAALPAAARDACELIVRNDSPPMLCDEHSRLNHVLSRLAGQTASIGVSYATDASALQKLGMNCVVCGPGDISDAHRANESIDIAEWQAAGRRLDDLVRIFCVEDAA